MIKGFWMMVAFLALMVGGVVIHYVSFDNDEAKGDLLNVANLSHITSSALSVTYDEPRTRSDYKDNISYPEMPPTNKMDFVYAK